jgi:hypothetical protein
LEKLCAENLEALISKRKQNEFKELIISILDLFNTQMVIRMIERGVAFLPIPKGRGFLQHIW